MNHLDYMPRIIAWLDEHLEGVGSSKSLSHIFRHDVNKADEGGETGPWTWVRMNRFKEGTSFQGPPMGSLWILRQGLRDLQEPGSLGSKGSADAWNIGMYDAGDVGRNLRLFGEVMRG